MSERKVCEECDRQTDRQIHQDKAFPLVIYSTIQVCVEWVSDNFGLDLTQIDPLLTCAKNDFYIFVLSDLDL